MAPEFDLYLETGAKRTFAAALDWPGWCRPGRNESDAAILTALRASAAGEVPARGPRGGARWTARYFVRRVAWHVMAHAWEIERRAAPGPR